MTKERIYFGTDGIRGTANQSPMTPDIALKLGQAAGQVFMRGDHRHRVIIAKDTRLSGYMIEPALTAGFVSVGMDVVLVGPMPTPAVAMLTRSMRADIGVMISASHNPYHDNGIKLFGPDGFKLSDAREHTIEGLMQSGNVKLASPDKLGRARRLDDARGRYIEFVKNTFPKQLRLDGLKIVIDCANGAAYHIAPAVLFELGAEVIPLGITPDGFNINRDCGSTNPKYFCEAVVAHCADLGIALDGDADRLAMCDNKGNLIDGDQLMAMIAVNWHKKGLLKGNGIVATDMSNLAFENYLKKVGLKLHRAKIGDRYVVEAMRHGGYNVGGEQSGHIILSDYSTTGDGLVAALQVIAVMLEEKKSLRQVSNIFIPMPQVLRNVRYNNGSSTSPLDRKEVKEAIKTAEQKLGKNGRILVRKSGTEPLIRIMAESEDEKEVKALTEMIAKVVEEVARIMLRKKDGRVLIIAGSDSGGGAGVQGDIKTVTMLGGYASSAISALTAQNTLGVFGIHDVPDGFIEKQIRLVLDDIGADAIKTGMLHKASVIKTISGVLKDYPNIPLVLDPVMVSKSGVALLQNNAIKLLIEKLIPCAQVITPNVPEAELLTDRKIRNTKEMHSAGETLLKLGCKAVLMKGGHLKGDTVTDILITSRAVKTFTSKRIKSKHTHGTGCTLASAIATGIAQGLSLEKSVERARDYVAEAIRTAPGFGKGHGPLNHGHVLKKL